MMMRQLINRVLLCCSVLILTGCETTLPNHYYYGNYSQNLYEYFKSTGSSPQEQILSLQQTVLQAKARNLPLAPGIHAHLGHLYLLNGQSELGFAELHRELQIYPESRQYIEFLLKNARGGQ